MIQLTIRVDRADAGLVLAELAAFVPGGFEERQAGEAIEFVLYGAAGELPDVGDVRAAVGGRLIDVSTAELPDDWGEDWRSFHKPIDVGPAAGPPAVGAGARRARSTSSSTRARRSARARTPPPGSRWSCSRPWSRRARSPTGAAAAACWRSPPPSSAGRRCCACDVEPESVAATLEGAAVNGVSVEVTRCDVRQGGPPAPTVLANLVRPLLLQVAAGMTELPDRLIISGLEGDEPDEVVPAFERRGLRETRRRSGDNWSAIELEKPKGA